jgi:ParB family chromosome partitioning protein
MMDRLESSYAPIEKICPNPFQPRKNFDKKALLELARSIRERGIIQPLLVTAPDDSGVFTLIAGERRLRAAKIAGLTEVPISIRGESGPTDLQDLALIENIQRENMTFSEEGAVYIELREKGMTYQAIEDKYRVGRHRVAHRVACASLPEEARVLVDKGDIYSNKNFVDDLLKIAEIGVEDCINLAKELAARKPSLSASKKSARAILERLREKLSGEKERGVTQVIAIARKIHPIDREKTPANWNVLRQAGTVPDWKVVIDAATLICMRCELYDIASSEMCSACTAAQMLACMASNVESEGKNGSNQ